MTRTELIERVKALREAKTPYSAIAQELDITRNVVSGILNRLGLCKPMVRGVRQRQPRIGDKDYRLTNIARRRAKAEAQRARRADGSLTPLVINETPPPAAFLGIAFDDLDWSFRKCRFPRGEPVLFCGQPVVSGESWCPACHGIVFRPVMRAQRARAA